MRRQTKIFVVSATISLLIAAVGLAQDNGPVAGTYISSITEAEIPSTVPADAKAILVGKWTMSLAADQTYRIAKDGKLMVEGHFLSSTKEIKITDESGDLACTPMEMKTGVYRWSIEDQKLTFTPVTDNCVGRRLVLEVHPWTQAPRVGEPNRESPPTPKPTPPEDTGRYLEWLNKRGASFSDRPHEEVTLRIGDWGFFYRGDRQPGSWTPLKDRTGLDRSGHAVTQAENSDWYAFLGTSGLDASTALKRVAWLLNADGLFPDSEPQSVRRTKIAAPTLTINDGTITFQGACEAHSDPPYRMQVTIVAASKGSKVAIETRK